MTACGGGGSGGSDAVCADFKYQEDAQAAYAAGATQLDRDNDGVACESLPHRPTGGGSGGGGSGGGGSVPPAPAYNFMSAHGETVSLAPAGSGQYAMAFWGPFSSVSDPGPIPLGTQGPVTLVTNNWMSVRYGTRATDLVPGWAGGVNAIGFTPITRFLYEVSGLYRAIGQVCPQGMPPCTPVVGTLEVVESGTLVVCVNQDTNSAPCTTPKNLPISRTPGDPEGMFVLDHVTARMLSSFSGGLAVTYQDVYESASNPRPSFVRTTWFAVRYGPENLDPLGATRFEGFANAGMLVNSPANGWALQDNQPMAGFRRDASGRMVLRSLNGQLVTWSTEEGLQAFVKR